MRKILLPFISAAFFLAMAWPAQAAIIKLNPASGQVSSGSTVKVEIDTQGAELQSAAAVISFDSSKVTLAVSGGTFFDLVSTDTSVANELAITGTLNFGKLTGVTGTGTLATLTLTPKITSGSFNLTIRCSEAERDDSNLINMANENLLATADACGSNVSGTYTVGSTSSPTSTPTPTDADEDDDDDDDDDNVAATATPVTSVALPETLPQSGPKDWLKWITSGLALLGIGLLLL